jgi:hypothetical protein
MLVVMTLVGVVSCATTARQSGGLSPVTLAFLSGVLVVMTLVGVPAARADGIGSDADTMSHLHPVRVAPGRYEAKLDTTERGTYAMTAEIARRGGGVQLLRGSVDGHSPAAPPTAAPPSQGEITATVAPAGSPSIIRARFGDTPDLQPWLGMVGHMMVVGPLPDGPDVGKHALTAPVWSHAHAMVPPATGAAGGQPDESVARYGPEIDFTYSFALPGRYRVWVQTERDYAILTAPTEVEVRQP